MLYDRVMKNLQKRIKHMNSFINARLKENWENLLKIHFQGLRSRVPPMSWVPGLRSRISPSRSRVSVSGPTYEMGLGSQVSDPTKSPMFRVPLFGYVNIFIINNWSLSETRRSLRNLYETFLRYISTPSPYLFVFLSCETFE